MEDVQNATAWEVVHEAEGFVSTKLFADEKTAIAQKDLLLKDMLVAERTK